MYSDLYQDETSHVIFLSQFENKKYKENVLREIMAAVCAMLNTNGGRVVIHFEIDSTILLEGISFPQMSLVIRILEQYMMSVIGLHQTVSKMNFEDDQDRIVISIQKADSLITINYNLYLPSQTQVAEVPPLEPPEKVRDIMHRQSIPNPVKRGLHCQTFCLKDKNCGLYESKMCQLKNLKAEQSKRTTLADRMTCKGNKFSCYVSAFANHNGGYIYYGITSEKVVEGEFIPNEKENEKITKQVEKAINKMIWPQQICQPKRGDHWEIFFESVIDETLKPVPATFVIVIYIAPCLGGVFTEEPASYEMVEGKVKKMSFASWRRRISQPAWLLIKQKIPHSVKRITWSSAAVRKIFIETSEKLRELIHDGNWHAISNMCKNLEKQPHSYEIKLAVLSKKVTACYRRGHYIQARVFLEQYMTILPQVKDALIFEVLGLHLQAALKRATGDLKGLKQDLTDALAKAEGIEPGLITSTLYVFAATVGDLVTLEEPKLSQFSPEVLSHKALQHSYYVVEDYPHFCADKKQKAHIILATFCLSRNLSGMPRKNINIKPPDLDKAKASLIAVQQAIFEGNPLSWYREVQYNLVQSIYYYRHSQAHPDQRVYFLRSAFNYIKRAECVARFYQFKEMVEWSMANKALCTEELVQAKMFDLKLNHPNRYVHATKSCQYKKSS